MPVTLPGTPNVATMLGQLASPGAPVGPIPVTPYAPENVQPLWMPAETPGTPPKIAPPKPQQQFNFGGFGSGAGGAMPGTSQGAPRNTDAVTTGAGFSQLTPAQQQARIAAGTAPPQTNMQQQMMLKLGLTPRTGTPAPAPAAPKPAAAPVQHPATSPQALQQVLTNMGVPPALHPQIMQSVLQPAALGGGPVTSGRR